MKTKVSILLIILSSTSLFAQKNYQIKLGEQTYDLRGVELLPDSLDESSYYNIQNGYFDYFYVNAFDGEVIEYDHIYCEVGFLDPSSVSFETKSNYTVMIIKSKDNEPNIVADNWNLSEGRFHKLEFSTDYIRLYIPNEAVGKQILKEIKKGKDL